jgi:hypothetical protein
VGTEYSEGNLVVGDFNRRSLSLEKIHALDGDQHQSATIHGPSERKAVQVDLNGIARGSQSEYAQCHPETIMIFAWYIES